MRRSSSRRGFTLTELAICLSLLAILMPMIYTFGLQIEDRFRIGQWHLKNADTLRTVAEALQADQQGGVLAAEGVAFAFDDCEVRYTLDEGAIVRSDSCGVSLTLARGVAAMSREDGGVALLLEHRLRVGQAQQQTVFIPLEAR